MNSSLKRLALLLLAAALLRKFQRDGARLVADHDCLA
jgi:hypothetical protein